MRKLIVAATGAAALLVASSLSAIAAEATGQIVQMISDTRTVHPTLPAGSLVMLDDGRWFSLPATVNLADFKLGQNVKIVFDPEGRGAASAITAS